MNSLYKRLEIPRFSIRAYDERSLTAVDAKANPEHEHLSCAFRRQIVVKFNSLVEYQARVEYGSESSIVSELQTLGALDTTPLRNTYTAISLSLKGGARPLRFQIFVKSSSTFEIFCSVG